MIPGINVVESPQPPAIRRAFMQRLIARIGSGAAERGAAFAGAKADRADGKSSSGGNMSRAAAG
jgi:hypothetical protein